MKNPFTNGPDKAEREHQKNLAKWERMDPVLGRVLRDQARPVQEITGRRIEQAWTAKARNSGQLFPYTEESPTGHTITKYEGDIRAAFAPFTLPSVPFEISKVVWHDNSPYLASQIPPSVQAARALAEIGRPER